MTSREGCCNCTSQHDVNSTQGFCQMNPPLPPNILQDDNSTGSRGLTISPQEACTHHNNGGRFLCRVSHLSVSFSYWQTQLNRVCSHRRPAEPNSTLHSRHSPQAEAHQNLQATQSSLQHSIKNPTRKAGCDSRSPTACILLTHSKRAFRKRDDFFPSAMALKYQKLFKKHSLQKGMYRQMSFQGAGDVTFPF